MKLIRRPSAFPLPALLLLMLVTVVGARGSQKGSASHQANGLQIYFIDVEGGQATLFVPSGGDSLLIDTGWPGHDGRDAGRIVAAARRAGLSKIDYVLLTHYHDDHVGGVPQLVARIPVGTFIDHGPNRELDHGVTEAGYAAYQKVLAAGGSKRIAAAPGEVLPVRGMKVTVVSADGQVLAKPLAGAGADNPFCAVSEVRPADTTENGRSLGVEIAFGRLNILDLGDLTWDKERELVCPRNRLGRIDLLVVSHHGWYESSSPALVDAIHARVAVMDNGARKGGSTATLKTFAKAPGLETLWQLHFSDEGGLAANTPSKYIANLAHSDANADAGNFIEVTAAQDGGFKVFNSRTGVAQAYSPRR